MQGLRFNFWSENLIPLITTNVHMPQQKSKIPHVATKTELLNKLINQNKYSIIKINKFLKNLSFKKVRMAAIKISSNNKCWRGCREKGTLLRCWWECKLVQSLWRAVWRFLKKLEIELPYNPAIPLLGIHTKETGTRIERDTCTPMFITALFTIAKTWKQPRCPSADEWIRKLWYIYTMEYYSAIKKNAYEPVLTGWMKLEPIIQNKVSQK